MSRRKYSKEQVIELANISTSYSQILVGLNLDPTGGNYKSLKKYLKENDIKIPNYLGQAVHKDKKFGPKRAIEDYLSNKYTITSDKLRRRLIKENIFPYQCNSCKLTEWLGKPIPIELEHKDGNHFNNNLSNLEILCNNCHAFTPTYRGKNKAKKLLAKIQNLKVAKKTRRSPKICKDCNKTISYKSIRCKSCAGKYYNSTKIVWPETKELIEILKTSNYLQLSKKLGVSDNAIRKRIKNYPIQ